MIYAGESIGWNKTEGVLMGIEQMELQVDCITWKTAVVSSCSGAFKSGVGGVIPTLARYRNSDVFYVNRQWLVYQSWWRNQKLQ